MKRFASYLVALVVTITIIVVWSYLQPQVQHQEVDRFESIPDTAFKIFPEQDNFPPLLHSDEYIQPQPLEAISTAGAEDSPFVQPGTDDIYFFFTPDGNIPAEQQVEDGVTGIWVSKLVSGEYQEAERVFLQDPSRQSLDGCAWVGEDKMMFCTAREGFTGLHWFEAELVDNQWRNWQKVEFEPSFDVGELHIYEDQLYYHSTKAGGQGQHDIWMLNQEEGKWGTPVNVTAVNSDAGEYMPFITSDGMELWFHRDFKGSPAVYRSRLVKGEWQTPQLIVSQFAGEPTVDSMGNLYFVHHYFEDGVMLEADIYVAKKR